VQQTFVAALEHPPGPATPLRRWLGAVVRNFARQDRRGERRRNERELSAARPEASASVHDAVDAIAVQRALFDAVLALDEPYRSSILQRYYEGLPPREIARRQRVPVKTVKTRLARGLERLRAALDRGHGGDRQAWLPALLPLAGWPGIPASTLGTLLVNTKIKIAIGVVALAGALAAVWSVFPTSQPSAPLSALAADPKPALERAEPGEHLAATAPSSARETVSEPSHLPVQHDPHVLPPSRPVVARGRVIDVDGRAVAGVPIVLRAREPGTQLNAFRSAERGTDEPLATSLADGSFEIASPPHGGTLLARSPQFTTAFAADIWQSQDYDKLVVIVAPRGGLGGTVVDPEGKSVPNAALFVRVDRALLAGLAGIADQSFEIPWRGTTDDHGHFEIVDAPAMKGATLTASASGWSEVSQPAPERPTFDLRIVLGHAEKPIPRGEVVDAHGRPVPGALVSCNQITSKTDEQGRFSIELDRYTFTTPMPGPVDEIVALKEGFLPAHFVKPVDGWPASVTLRLEGESLAIRGRVVDEAGTGVSGVTVWAIDELDFGIVMEEVSRSGRRHSIESLLRGGRENVPTGKDGSFVLDGLIAGEYRLGCMQYRTLLSGRSDHVAAGSDQARLVLLGADRCVRVAGRVVSRAGKPVEGVMLHPGRKIPRWPFGEDPLFPMQGQPQTTDAEGRFAFESLSPEGLSFQLLSPSLVVMEWTPPADAKLGELEIVVALRCHVQVDLGDRKELADSFTLLGKDGERMGALEYQGPIVQVDETVPIEKGVSPIVAVTEDAKTIVLSKAGVEVVRLPLALVPGELKVVRP
jgi:RNA polymerase sigma factor (sigma-70 family)